jgi:hypothetical protein
VDADLESIEINGSLALQLALGEDQIDVRLFQILIEKVGVLRWW